MLRNKEFLQKSFVYQKLINFRFVLVGIGLIAIVKIINDQNNRIDTIEEELSELNTEGE